MITQEQHHEHEQPQATASVLRRHETSILKEGRHTNLSISQVCEQYQISPTLFYQWERQADQLP